MNFIERTVTVTAPEPIAATSTPAAAISRAVFEPRLFGVANRAGEGVDGAMCQLGDQHQAGTEDDKAPAALVDSQERGGDHDQGSAVAVCEEAGVTPDCRLETAPAGGQLAPRVAPIGLGSGF